MLGYLKQLSSSPLLAESCIGISGLRYIGLPLIEPDLSLTVSKVI